MNGLYFYSTCVGFLFNKKKMSDYYGDYLFSSPYGVYFISIIIKNLIKAGYSEFSSPPGAYLISMN